MLVGLHKREQGNNGKVLSFRLLAKNSLFRASETTDE